MAGVCLRTYLVHSTYVFLVMYQGYESRKNCKPSVLWRAGGNSSMETFQREPTSRSACVSMTGALSSRDQSAIAIFFTVRTRALVQLALRKSIQLRIPT